MSVVAASRPMTHAPGAAVVAVRPASRPIVQAPGAAVATVGPASALPEATS